MNPTHKNLIPRIQMEPTLEHRQLQKIEGIKDMIHEHEHNCLCKVSRKEAWFRPRAKQPYFDVKAQERRAARVYEKNVLRVFKKMRARFNKAYRRKMRQAGNTVVASLLLNPLRTLNPLATAAKIGDLEKSKQLTQEDWEEIVTVSMDGMEGELAAALLVNVNGEVKHMIKKVQTAMLEVHGKAVVEDIDVILPHVEDFLKKYELRLSERTLAITDGRLKEIIRDGMVHGHSNQRIRDTMLKHYDQLTKKHAFTIARTETIRASAQGSKLAYMSTGIAQVDVLPALDACPVCVNIASNNPYKVTDPQAYPPFHPNCRCTPVPVVAGHSVYDGSIYPEVYTTEGGNPTFTEQ